MASGGVGSRQGWKTVKRPTHQICYKKTAFWHISFKEFYKWNVSTTQCLANSTKPRVYAADRCATRTKVQVTDATLSTNSAGRKPKVPRPSIRNSIRVSHALAIVDQTPLRPAFLVRVTCICPGCFLLCARLELFQRLIFRAHRFQQPTPRPAPIVFYFSVSSTPLFYSEPDDGTPINSTTQHL